MIVHKRRRAVTRSAFTLMEILVVVAIIVMLAGIGGVYFINQQRHAQKNAAQIQCRTLIQVCEAFAANNNALYPTTLQDLFDGNYVGVPYLKDASVLHVPWGNRQETYEYAPPDPQRGSTQPHVWVIHPDGTVIGNPPAQ